MVRPKPTGESKNSRRTDLGVAGAIASGLILILPLMGAAQWPESLFVIFILVASLWVYYRAARGHERGAWLHSEAGVQRPPLNAAGAGAGGRSGARDPVAPSSINAPSPEPERDFDRDLDLDALVAAIPEAFLVVRASAYLEIIAANAEARTLFGVQGQAPRFSSVMRSPNLLDGLHDVARENRPHTARFTLPGSVERFFRADMIPLAWRGEPLILMWVRDESTSLKIERMRVDFLANASHELKTPLASLIGFIQTLRGHARNDPEAQERFLIIMEAQAERMSRLIADLLSLSKIEINEHVPPAGPGDLRAAIDEAVREISVLARNNAVTLEVEIGQAPVIVRAMPDDLVQCMQNLLDNAVKYTPRGGVVRIEMSAGLTADAALSWGARRWSDAGRVTFSSLTAGGATSAPGTGYLPNNGAPQQIASARRFAVVRVSDGGPGIAREHLARLSERFYRVPLEEAWPDGQEPGWTEPERLYRRGTGLGLAIVKHIVNRSRGGFAAESVRGKGSAFTLSFPMLNGDNNPTSS